MDSSDTPVSSKGWILFNLNVALIVITSLVVIVRLYTRRYVVRALGLDDLLATISLGFVVALSVIEIQLVKYGSGTPIQELSPQQRASFFALFPIGQLLYFIGTAFIRLSILAFLPRLDRDRIFMRYIWVTGFCITVTSLVAFFLLLTSCKPIIDLFHPEKQTRQCGNPKEKSLVVWTHAIISVVIDIVLLGLPIWVIRRKMRLSTKAIKVILVFCVGLFVLITGVIRLVIILTAHFSVDTTYKMIQVAPWTDLEVHVGLWCGSFPAIQPLIRMISHKAGLTSTLQSTAKTPNPTAERLSLRTNTRRNPIGYHQQESAIDIDSDAESQRIIIRTKDSRAEVVEMEDVYKHPETRFRADAESIEERF